MGLNLDSIAIYFKPQVVSLTQKQTRQVVEFGRFGDCYLPSLLDQQLKRTGVGTDYTCQC